MLVVEVGDGIAMTQRLRVRQSALGLRRKVFQRDLPVRQCKRNAAHVANNTSDALVKAQIRFSLVHEFIVSKECFLNVTC